jgi:hypothetical protein
MQIRVLIPAEEAMVAVEKDLGVKQGSLTVEDRNAVMEGRECGLRT